MLINADNILKTFRPIPLTPGAIKLMASGWKPPEDIVIPDFSRANAPPIDERIKQLRETILLAETGIRNSTPDEGLLLHNNVRLPLIELRQQLTNEARANMPLTKVSYDEAKKVVEEILYAAIQKKTGASHSKVNKIDGFEDEVKVVSEALADSQGQIHPTHGVIRILDYAEAILDGRINPQGEIKLVKEEYGKLYFDGGGTFGQAAVQYALQESLKFMDSKEGGAVVVTLRNAYHAGRLEWIVRQAARQGYDSIALFNVGGWGRTGPEPDAMEPRWGTNPIALGASTGIGEDGSVGDVATVARPEGWVREAHLAGYPVPLGVVRTPEGTPTTETADVYRKDDLPPDMILPLGGELARHKGAVLGGQIELLADAFSGREEGEANKPKGNNLVLVLSKGNANTHAGTREKVAHIESCPTASSNPVRIPGKVGAEKLRAAKKDGLQVSTDIWGQILELHQSIVE